MDNREVAMRCMEIATKITSPSVVDRVNELNECSTLLYNHVMLLAGETSQSDKPRSKRSKPGIEILESKIGRAHV